jgi:predicted O-methyltransferase YrrM
VFDNVGALSTLNNLLVLRALMMDRRPASTLEIGLSFGGSALCIAASHRDLQRRPERQHVAIDPFQRTVWDDCGRQRLSAAALDGYVEIREGRSSAVLPELIAEGRAFDLIYVDGSHLFEDVFVDAYFSAQLLVDGGLVLFDDCTNDHVAKVLKFIKRNWNGWIVESDISGYRPDGSSVRHQVARQLGKTQLRAFERTGPPREWDAAFRDF